jgi:hypothetical protein
MADPLQPLPPIPPLGKLPPLALNTKRTPEHHGVLDTILAIPGHIVDDAVAAATGVIPGIIETGKAVGGDIGDLMHGDPSFSRSERIALAVLKGVAEDFRHPLRRPLNTIFDVWGIASGGAGLAVRGTAGLRAAAEGGNVAKALAFGPAPVERVMRLEGKPDIAAGAYSKNPLTRQIQMGLDTVREANPDRRVAAIRTQTQRYANANVKKNYRFQQEIERAAANELDALSKKVSPAEQVALRLYAENTPVEQRIAYHEALINDLSKLEQRNTQRGIHLMEAAKKYVVTDGSGQVQWAPGTEKLQEAYAKMADVVGRREQALFDAGLLTPEGAATRRSYPARVLAGARYYSSEKAARDRRFLDGRIKQNDAETAALAQRLSDARSGTNRTRAAEANLGAATATAGRLRATGSAATRRGRASLEAMDKRIAQLTARIQRLEPDMDRLREIAPLSRGAGHGEVQDALLRMHVEQGSGAFDAARSVSAAVGAKLKEALARAERASDPFTAAMSKYARPGEQPRHVLARLERQAQRERGVAATELRAAAKAIREYITAVDDAAKLERDLVAATRKEQSAFRSRESLKARLTRSREQMQAEFDRLAVVQRQYENNIRKLIAAQKERIVAEAELAASKATDAATREKIIAEAESRLKVARDAQQAFIILQKRSIMDLQARRQTLVDAMDAVVQNAGKIVGGDGANEGRVMVPYQSANALASIFKVAGLGSRGVVGVPKSQAWLKPWKGTLLAKGGGRYDTLALQAERTHEAIRFIALVKFRDALIQMGSNSPVGMRDPIALRLDAMKNTPLPADVRQILGKVDGDIKLKKGERDLLGTTYETIRDTFFDAAEAKKIDMENFTPVEGIRWIERDMLGGLDKPSPLVGLDSGAGRIVLRRLDDINNVAKFITLYLRPATLFPNLLSGIALNLIQQGMFAPSNLARAYALHWKMRPAARLLLDQVMGEGRMGALRSDRGIAAGLVNAGAGLFGTVQDLPFRRASFLHEARREGYRTLKDIDRLLTDPELRDTLYRVKERANAAIIDYSNLGKFERDILRRAFYFYPWLKGASVYTGRFIAENPVQAMVAGQVGRMGSDVSEQQFGELPSWAKGLYQIGSRDGLPLSVMTGSVLPFSTAADMAGTVLGLASGGASPSQKLAANLSPVASAFLAALTGKSGLGATLPQRGFLDQFARQLYDNTTLASLQKKLTEDQSEKTYPVTQLDAILGYLLGNTVYARPTNVDVLNRLAAKEQSGA